MSIKTKNLVETIKKDPHFFMQFLKALFPVFHNSNFFFRDLQYGVKRYFENKNIFLSIAEAENTAIDLSKILESEGYFVKVNKGTWRISYQNFVTQTPGDPF